MGVAAHKRFTAADLSEYRLKRNLRLERENEWLRAHRKRLERLLADTLRIATSGTDIEALTLLGVLEAMQEMGKTKDELPAEQLERVVNVLRETA